MSTRKIIIISAIAINILVAILASTFSVYYLWWLVVTLPILWSAIAHSMQKKHAILRNRPVLGLVRYFFESIRPELRHYLWELDRDGKPFNRRRRSIVDQRAKNERGTVAFRMQSDPNQLGDG